MKKIMICDDDMGILEVMQVVLDDAGYDVKIISSGKSIKDQISEWRPDMLFLDIWMPEIDGKQITKDLKEDPKFKLLPIITISALNDTEKISKEIGADDFLAKPFNIDDLLGKVEKYLRGTP